MSALGRNTIGELIDAGQGLHAYCYASGCEHRGIRLDLGRLAERLGRDHSVLHDDLVPKLRCSKCGSKNVGIRHSISASD